MKMNSEDQSPYFVNAYRAQESIAPGWESIPGLLKRSTNTGSDIYGLKLRVHSMDK
jgi:hypothetical protein